MDIFGEIYRTLGQFGVGCGYVKKHVFCWNTISFGIKKMAEIGELFSLEEDECSEMFITQEPTNVPNVGISLPSDNTDKTDGMLLGVSVDDFQSPCSSLVNRHESGIYSDISEDECVFQCSQKVQQNK